MKKSVFVTKLFKRVPDKIFPPEVRADVEAIERAPDNQGTVDAYGKQAVDELQKITAAIDKLEENFEGQVQDLGRLFDRSMAMIDGVKVCDADRFVLKDLAEISQEMRDTAQAVKEILNEAKKLSAERIRVNSLFTDFIGAGQDNVVVQYRKKYIPAADKNFRRDKTPENGLYAENVQKCRDSFIGHLGALENQRISGVHVSFRIFSLLGSAGEIYDKTLNSCESVLQMQNNCLAAVRNKADLERDLLVFTQGLKKPLRLPKTIRFPQP